MDEAIKAQWLSHERKDDLHFFPLEGLLPAGQALSVNTDYLIVSHVLINSAGGNPILLQRLLTELQMRLLLPLLESPHYCPHEVLYTSLFCSYRGLLARFFSSDSTAREEWLAAMQETRSLLERAQARGMWRKELKQIYNVLSELRAKLRPFGIGISISTSGSAYALISLPASEREAHEPWRVPPWAANGSSQPSLSGAI